MTDEPIGSYFEKFINKDSIFVDKKYLQSTYTPTTILHRDEQIKAIADILAPVLKLERPSNLFVYGKTGTGKTVTVHYTTNEISKVAQKYNKPVKVCYLNCKLKKIADTEYRLIAHISRMFGKAIPPTGLPTDEVYNIFYKAIDSTRQIILLVLDEIDQLIKKAGDEILYNLTRINEQLTNAQVCLIGISNDLLFIDNIDPRIKSSLSEEELVFPPYNAIQIQEILLSRAKKAFKPGVVAQGVIEKCAAYAAREHGDARRALDLLRVAGEIADREGSGKILISHIDKAERKIERDRVLDIVSTYPRQFQLVLYAIMMLRKSQREPLYTGEIYEVYKGLCKRVSVSPLTQRRVSDILGELDMLGLINAKVISKGRYGRTREISLSVPDSTIPKIEGILESALHLS
ncbi:cell division control protein Cdc6 [Candidatus Woesearchaeota archaeon]|nr:ORC1-type DNA replication protein [Candidatus Woesearchaeota archaeon]RLE43159.1 MAG: cell division control protein Cdc6 [Candidatus Woesearchaeota archaeon]